MKLIKVALLVMMLSGCTTIPMDLPQPAPPSVLMTAPSNPIEIKTELDFKEFLEIVARTNALANATRVQLQELQQWVTEIQALRKR
jgi:starvation-inducible outer membrane lipoprotein